MVIAMTYSQEVKNEICALCGAKAFLSCKDCKKALIYGMLMCCRGIREDSITLNIENKTIVDFFTESLIDFTGAIVTVQGPSAREYSEKKSKHPFFTISIADQDDINRIISFFFGDITNKHSVSKELLKKPCCRVSFLRGVYLICGSMINPQKEYHFELSLSSNRLSEQLLTLLLNEGFVFKKTERANSIVLYLKESNKIEDILTFLGAVKSTLALINLKIEKEMRNNVNRVTNCETANIGKTVNASLLQLEKIKRIRDIIGLDELAPELQEVALLRLLNPEASLRDLCELNGNKMSKSGLNHRLKKLTEIADKL